MTSLRWSLRSLPFLLGLWIALLPRDAEAIPYFAHRYGMVCQKCHSIIPRLNDFGLRFMEHGYVLPGTNPAKPFPISTKVNVAYTSDPDPGGLPKAAVDEVELFLAGTLGSQTNYFVEQYAIDGGRPGSTRDAWLNHRFTPENAKIAINLQGGSFTLPLPVDPETFRETARHYAVFDRVVGNNPFNFFDPKAGVQARAGDATHGTSVRLLALQGHDRQSGLPTLGIDFMGYAQHALGPVTVAAYRYAGKRPDGARTDRFWRQGYGLTYGSRRWTSETVLQTGNDSSIDATGTASVSSGGFTQLRYEIDRRLFALARYEGTNDASGGFARDLVALLGYRVSRNSRLTIEDVITHVPVAKHTLDTQYTFAY